MAQTPPEGPMSHMDNPPSLETPGQRERLWQPLSRFLDIFGAANPLKRYAEDYIHANGDVLRDPTDKECSPDWTLDRYFQVVGKIYEAKHPEAATVSGQNPRVQMRALVNEVFDFSKTRNPAEAGTINNYQQRVNQFFDAL